MPNYGPCLGKLIHQLPGDITLACDLHLTCTIPRYKYICKAYNFLCGKHQSIFHVALIFPKKHHLGPQNGSRCSGPEKLLKIMNYATIKEMEKLKETMVGPQVE